MRARIISRISETESNNPDSLTQAKDRAP